MQAVVVVEQMKVREQAADLADQAVVAAEQIGLMTEQDNQEPQIQVVVEVVADLDPQQAAHTLQLTELAVLEL
jgi:hypothetical protein